MDAKLRIGLGTGMALLAAGGLASCSRSADNAATAAPAAGAYSQSPGQYETSFRITSASVEGFPPEIQEQIRQAQQRPATQQQCNWIGISMDSMSLRNLRFTLPENRGGCNVAEISTESGRMRAALSCEITNLPQREPTMPRNITFAVNMEGTYAADTFDATARAELTVPGDDSRRGNVELAMSSRRVGDCPPGSMPNMRPPSRIDGPPETSTPPAASENGIADDPQT